MWSRAPASASAALTAAALLLAGACASGDDGSAGDGDATDGSTTTVVVRSTAEEAPLEVGQCGDVERIRVGEAIDPASIVTVPCADPHDVEVGAVFDHPSDLDADFPGPSSVDAYATDQCLLRFEEYVGRPYEASSLDVVFVAPDEDGWEDGDRRIACVLYHIDFAPLTGSVRGADV